MGTLANKDAKKKLSPTNARALNTMRQRLKKHNIPYQEAIDKLREQPDLPTESEAESEAASESEESESEDEGAGQEVSLASFAGNGRLTQLLSAWDMGLGCGSKAVVQRAQV